MCLLKRQLQVSNYFTVIEMVVWPIDIQSVVIIAKTVPTGIGALSVQTKRNSLQYYWNLKVDTRWTNSDCKLYLIIRLLLLFLLLLSPYINS